MLLSFMGELVCLEVVCTRKGIVALVAGKHILSCMRELVSLKVTCLQESFVTLVARKHLLSCMRELVCFEVTCQRENFATLVAGNHLLSCMREALFLWELTSRLKLKYHENWSFTLMIFCWRISWEFKLYSHDILLTILMSYIA